MALFQVAVTKRNGKDFSRTYGLNTENVINFYYDSDNSRTVFYYAELENRRVKTIKYETSVSYSTFEDYFNETQGKRRLNLQVVARGINDETWSEDVNVDADRILYVWDDGSYGRVVFENGAFDTLCYKTTEKLADILTEESSSVSA